MSQSITINNKIKDFNKKIEVPGDKSISIRWVLFSSLADGKSTAKNLLLSEDVRAALKVIKKLGIKAKVNLNKCIIYGKGINGYKYKKPKVRCKKFRYLRKTNSWFNYKYKLSN